LSIRLATDLFDPCCIEGDLLFHTRIELFRYPQPTSSNMEEVNRDGA
jgi:hypothetical protein